MMKSVATLLLIATLAYAQRLSFEASSEAKSCRDVYGADKCGEDTGYELLQPEVPADAAGDNKDGNGDEASTTSSAASANVQALDMSNNVDLLQDSKLANLCFDLDNLAVSALPSGSGGGVTTYGPDNMNDESQCEFYWPAGNSATIQYRWKQAVNIDHFVIVTDAYCEAGSICSHTNAGRGIGRGTVQYWGGASWVTDGSFTNTGRTITYRFRDCVSTIAIRVINMATHNCGQQLNPVVYEWSVCECEQDLLKLCGNSTNLAPFATPTGSGGGVTTYGPSNMNDLKECQWYWPAGNNAWINYAWDTPVYVGRFVILTDPACAINTMCSSYPNLGRGVADGTVWYQEAATGTWVADGAFRSREGKIEYELRTCVEISALRINGISTHNCGQQSNPVIYEWSACCCEPDKCCH